MAPLRDDRSNGVGSAAHRCDSELAVCGGGSIEPAGILCQLYSGHDGCHSYRDGHTQATWPSSKTAAQPT